ncbi:MAG: chemotaxis protein CheW [Desulfosporosinus sp.]|nr:chemotaxis protein CheW [Desulfosporosinus sp.]
MGLTKSCLLFCLEEGRYALDLTAVERIVRAVEVTLVPNAPDFVRGLINVAGDIVLVIDMRQRLGLPIRDIELSDRLILTNVAGRLRALLVDGVEGVVELPTNSVTSVKSAVTDTTPTAAIINGSIVLIQTIEAFVSESPPLQVEDIWREDAHG